MKKSLILTLTTCVLTMTQMWAQTPTFTKGDNVASLGVGFGGTLYSGYSYWSGIKKLPFLSVSFEHCIIDNLFDEKSSLGVGGLVGYTSAKIADTWKSSDILVGARGVLHYALVNKLDTYAGLMLGYDIHTWKWVGHESHTSAGGSGLAYAVFAGARYYFADSFAAFAELGYGYAIINLGISLKF